MSMLYNKWKWRSLNLSRGSRILKWCNSKRSSNWKMLCRPIQLEVVSQDPVRWVQRKDTETVRNEGLNLYQNIKIEFKGVDLHRFKDEWKGFLLSPTSILVYTNRVLDVFCADIRMNLNTIVLSKCFISGTVLIDRDVLDEV